MSKHFYMKFNVGDWKKDPTVQGCSVATRGVWFELLAAMFEAGGSGSLCEPREVMARLANCSLSELDAAIDELNARKTADVTFFNGNVTITNRRMARESQVRSAARLRQEKHRSKKARNADVTAPYIELELELNTEKKKKVKKKKSTESKKRTLFDLNSQSLPDSLNTPEFRAEWSRWIEYRRTEKRKPVTETAARQQLADLAEHGAAIAIAAIRRSIKSDWQGLFPEREVANGTHAGNGRPSRPSVDPNSFPEEVV